MSSLTPQEARMIRKENILKGHHPFKRLHLLNMYKIIEHYSHTFIYAKVKSYHNPVELDHADAHILKLTEEIWDYMSQNATAKFAMSVDIALEDDNLYSTNWIVKVAFETTNEEDLTNLLMYMKLGGIDELTTVEI